MRFLADSNRRKRFCRPAPSHSAKEPFLICECKSSTYFSFMQINLGKSAFHCIKKPEALLNSALKFSVTNSAGTFPYTGKGTWWEYA